MSIVDEIWLIHTPTVFVANSDMERTHRVTHARTHTYKAFARTDCVWLSRSLSHASISLNVYAQLNNSGEFIHKVLSSNGPTMLDEFHMHSVERLDLKSTSTLHSILYGVHAICATVSTLFLSRWLCHILRITKISPYKLNNDLSSLHHISSQPLEFAE